MRTHANRRTFLGLLALAALAANALVVLSPGSAAGPQNRSGTCCSSPPAHAQSVYPPGTIDGADHPELIPDEVAYKMLFLSLMEPENPTEAQRARQEAKLRMIVLSENDQASFLAGLSDSGIGSAI